MNGTLYLLIPLFAAFLTASCQNASDPNSFGGRLQAEGGDIAKIGKNWSDGEEAIAKGRVMVEDGEEDVEDGEDTVDRGESLVSRGERKIRRGQDMIVDGQRMKEEAEEAYRQHNQTPANRS